MATHIEHHALKAPIFDKSVRMLIVVAPYYKDIADQLVQGAQAQISKAGGTYELAQVPGALEIAPAIALARRHAQTPYDGFVALGCVIRGETTHYETVCNDSSRALQLLGLDGACIGNGILSVENYAQAQARAKAAGQDKGGGAALAALHLVALQRGWMGQKNTIGFQKA